MSGDHARTATEEGAAQRPSRPRDFAVTAADPSGHEHESPCYIVSWYDEVLGRQVTKIAFSQFSIGAFIEEVAHGPRIVSQSIAPSTADDDEIPF